MAPQAQGSGRIGRVRAAPLLNAAPVAIHRPEGTVRCPGDGLGVLQLAVAGPELPEAREEGARAREDLVEVRPGIRAVGGNVDVPIGCELEEARRLLVGLVSGDRRDGAHVVAIGGEDLDPLAEVAGVDGAVGLVHPHVPARIEGRGHRARGPGDARRRGPGGALTDGAKELAAWAEDVRSVVRVPSDVEVAVAVHVEAVVAEIAGVVAVSRHGRRGGRRDPDLVAPEAHQEVAAGVVLQDAAIVDVRDV
ncbi:hypothetical protein D3C86_1287930 [compost metagenome]